MVKTILSLSGFCWVLAAPLAATGPDGTISGPVLGFVFDARASAVRPVFGMAATAALGAPLELGGPVAQAAVSPGLDYLLATGASGGELRVFQNLAGPVRATSLAAPAGIGRILISPSGAAAAVASSEAIQVFTGLPNAPASWSRIDLATVPSPVTPWAVADDGLVVVSSPSGAGETLLALAPGGGARTLLALRRVSAAAFLNGRPDLVIADAGSKFVYLVRDVTGAAEAVVLGSGRDGLLEPAAVALSRDNRRVFVADPVARGVAVFELSGGPADFSGCRCAPQKLERLRGGAVFLLTGLSESPVWLLDGDGPQPRVLFVPPARLQAAGQSARGGRP